MLHGWPLTLAFTLVVAFRRLLPIPSFSTSACKLGARRGMAKGEGRKERVPVLLSSPFHLVGISASLSEAEGNGEKSRAY